MAVAKRTRKPLTDAQKQAREQRFFALRISKTFRNAGFAHIPTKDVARYFGNKKGEIDAVFVYENIIVVAEDTIAKTGAKDHLKNKKLLFDQIASNQGEFLAWLRTDFPERFEVESSYADSRYKVFFLYFAKSKIDLTDEDLALFAPVKVVEPSTFAYFQKMTANIRLSARADFFRYLDLKSKDIGVQESGTPQKSIETSIIYPTESTGLGNGVRIVSFMISAETLLRNSYVLRKDNWEDSIQLYQRLIERDRILSIRKYLAERETTFINNIIVSLPAAVTFTTAAGQPIALNDIENYDSHKMLIPDELNSICVIDGQHRIFAHYEGADSFEPKIAELRKKFHLLVTGLIFPSEMGLLQQRKFESEIFLDINSNAKPVPPDVLLFIETLKDPYSDLGVARQVLKRLNQNGVFKNLFQLSLMEDSRIKIASIIKFALRYLVEIVDSAERPSLFGEWVKEDGNRRALLDREDEALLAEYVAYAAKVLSQYFSALKVRYPDDWDNPESKILSTTSINAYIIALRRSLPALGVLDVAGYKAVFAAGTAMKFSKQGFRYTSSQYNKLSRVLLAKTFNLVESELGWTKRS